MSSISSLLSHVDWRNKGEVSMVMPVTSSLPEGLGIVPIVLHKRRRKEGQSRRKRALSQLACDIQLCSGVQMSHAEPLHPQRKWEQMLCLCLSVGKTGNLTYQVDYLPHLFDWCHANILVNSPLSVWKKGATRFGRCESLPSHHVDQSESCYLLVRVSSTFGQLIAVFDVTPARE